MPAHQESPLPQAALQQGPRSTAVQTAAAAQPPSAHHLQAHRQLAQWPRCQRPRRGCASSAAAYGAAAPLGLLPPNANAEATASASDAEAGTMQWPFSTTQQLPKDFSFSTPVGHPRRCLSCCPWQDATTTCIRLLEGLPVPCIESLHRQHLHGCCARADLICRTSPQQRPCHQLGATQHIAGSSSGSDSERPVTPQLRSLASSNTASGWPHAEAAQPQAAAVPADDVASVTSTGSVVTARPLSLASVSGGSSVRSEHANSSCRSIRSSAADAVEQPQGSPSLRSSNGTQAPPNTPAQAPDGGPEPRRRRCSPDAAQVAAAANGFGSDVGSGGTPAAVRLGRAVRVEKGRASLDAKRNSSPSAVKGGSRNSALDWRRNVAA